MGIKIGGYEEGSVPQTKDNNPLQVLGWNHKKGFVCKPHFHMPKTRTTNRLNECFIVQKGKVQLRLFGDDGKYFETVIINPGEAYLYMRGGHEATALKDTEMFEVKNGPFREDKEFF